MALHYFDLAIVGSLLVVWFFELVRRGNPSALYPKSLARFFENAFRLDYSNPGACRISLRKTCTDCLTLGNVFGVLQFPSVFITRRQVALGVTILLTSLVQYSYVLSGKLDPKTFLWLLFVPPTFRFLSITFDVAGSIQGSAKYSHSVIAPWLKYGIESFFQVCSLLGGIIVTRLVMCELSSRSWYFAAGALYCVSLVGSFVMNIATSMHVFRSQACSAELIGFVVSGQYYMGLSRLEAFVHATTTLSFVVVVFFGLADNHPELVGISPLCLIGSVIFSAITTSVTFARNPKTGRNVFGFAVNLLLLLTTVYGILAFRNSLCSFQSIPCSTTVSGGKAHTTSFQAASFWPVIASGLVLALGTQMSTFTPASMVRVTCGKEDEFDDA